MPNEKDKQTGKQKPKWHHFDMGNANIGSMGISGEVMATSKDQATRILQDALPDHIRLEVTLPGGGYINLYFNRKKIVRSLFNDTRELNGLESAHADILKKKGLL